MYLLVVIIIIYYIFSIVISQVLFVTPVYVNLSLFLSGFILNALSRSLTSGVATVVPACGNLYIVMVSVTLREDWSDSDTHFSRLSAADLTAHFSSST